MYSILPKIASRQTKRSFAQTRSLNNVVIVSAVRTPIGSYKGTLANVKAVELGSIAVKAAVEKSGLNPNQIDEVLLGNVLQAGQGQAPARQASMFAGLPSNVSCTTINKVCASGMKSIMFGAQSIMLGHTQSVVAGGFESMSNVPHYLLGLRKSNFNESKLIDEMIHDGLWDVYNQFHMGLCAENTAKKYNISRKEQDEYAILSYKRSAEATEKGYFADEIVGVPISSKQGSSVVTEDEEFKKVDFSKIPSLKPAFKPDGGSVTAANSSTINDGASSLVLVSEDFAKKNNLKPLARIVAFSDAERDPIDFPIAPALAVPIALKRAGLTEKDIDLWEINEAFAVVALANQKELNLSIDKLNVLGGGVSLGHPIGSSGSRIVTTLLHHLRRTNGRYGLASICNGGGGASAIILENVK